MKPCKGCTGAIPIFDPINNLCRLCFNNVYNELFGMQFDGNWPTGAKERKALPVYDGVRDYFPLPIIAISDMVNIIDYELAFIYIAKQTHLGHKQHDYPIGTPYVWDRSKSSDNKSAALRHAFQREIEPLLWRLSAVLQILMEKGYRISVGNGHANTWNELIRCMIKGLWFQAYLIAFELSRKI